MGTRAAGRAAVLALAAMLLSGSASAKPPWSTDLALINKGIDRALGLNRIDGTEAADYRSDANAAASVLPKLPSSRYKNLAAVLHQVAGFWKGYDSPRGLTLFAMLGFNTRWFASHWDQKPGKDVFDTSDGIWYRAFPGIGFQFHPLENFGKLNNFVAQKNSTRAEQLAQSLLNRSVVRSGGLAWEYYFRFQGGRPTRPQPISPVACKPRPSGCCRVSTPATGRSTRSAVPRRRSTTTSTSFACSGSSPSGRRTRR